MRFQDFFLALAVGLQSITLGSMTTGEGGAPLQRRIGAVSLKTGGHISLGLHRDPPHRHRQPKHVPLNPVAAAAYGVSNAFRNVGNLLNGHGGGAVTTPKLQVPKPVREVAGGLRTIALDVGYNVRNAVGIKSVPRKPSALQPVRAVFGGVTTIVRDVGYNVRNVVGIGPTTTHRPPTLLQGVRNSVRHAVGEFRHVLHG